jgi:hypothetical protein
MHCIAWHVILYFSKILEESRRISEKSSCQNSSEISLCKFLKPLYIQKSKFYLEIILLRFQPVQPSPSSAGPLHPSAAVHSLDPFGLSSLDVFAKRRLFFEFAQSGNDAFFLSRHCHVGPARQFHPSPRADRPQSRRQLASPHPITPRRPASSIEMPIKAPYSPALNPPLESPLTPSPAINGLDCKSSAVTHRQLHPEQPPVPIKGEHHARASPHLSPPLSSSLHA